MYPIVYILPPNRHLPSGLSHFSHHSCNLHLPTFLYSMVLVLPAALPPPPPPALH